MIGAIVGIVIFAGIVGAALWSGRGKDNGSHNGDNTDAARRYGGGL